MPFNRASFYFLPTPACSLSGYLFPAIRAAHEEEMQARF